MMTTTLQAHAALTIVRQAGRESCAAVLAGKSWRKAPAQCKIVMGAIGRHDADTLDILKAWQAGYSEVS